MEGTVIKIKIVTVALKCTIKPVLLFPYSGKDFKQ